MAKYTQGERAEIQLVDSYKEKDNSAADVITEATQEEDTAGNR